MRFSLPQVTFCRPPFVDRLAAALPDADGVGGGAFPGLHPGLSSRPPYGRYRMGEFFVVSQFSEVRAGARSFVKLLMVGHPLEVY